VRRKLLIFLLFLFWSLSATATTRVLFVGNSLTYVNNLPAVFAALAGSQGRQVETGMLVSGGASLQDHLTTGAVAAQLDGGHYATVVMQERGGMLACAPFAKEFCEHSRIAQHKLVALAHKHGARAFMLGTYQPAFAKRLHDNEQAFARAAGADAAVQVATAFAAHFHDAGELKWTANDGMHPGRDLTLLYAIQLYRAQFGVWPDPAGFNVAAPGYLPKTHFERSRLAREQQAKPAGRSVGQFTAAEMRQVTAIVRNTSAPIAG